MCNRELLKQKSPLSSASLYACNIDFPRLTTHCRIFPYICRFQNTVCTIIYLLAPCWFFQFPRFVLTTSSIQSEIAKRTSIQSAMFQLVFAQFIDQMEYPLSSGHPGFRETYPRIERLTLPATPAHLTRQVVRPAPIIIKTRAKKEISTADTNNRRCAEKERTTAISPPAPRPLPVFNFNNTERILRILRPTSPSRQLCWVPSATTKRFHSHLR